MKNPKFTNIDQAYMNSGAKGFNYSGVVILAFEVASVKEVSTLHAKAPTIQCNEALTESFS